MADKTNKLNICLVKSEFSDFDQIVEASTTSIQIDDVGMFFVEESFPHKPGWVTDFFGATIDGQFKILTASSKGVLLTSVNVAGNNRIFAITFGHGRHLLREGVVEDRFGLKVVLNTVVPDSLRSIDKHTLGSISKQSREQISKAGAAANFGINIEEDLIGAVTGSSKDPRLGKSISGKDALAVSVKVNVTDIRDFLCICFERYSSDDYKASFDWVDQIKDLKDPALINSLNATLVKRINNDELAKIWMTAPDILDWAALKGFRYARQRRGALHDDLSITQLLDDIDADEITLDELKDTPVFAISATTDAELDHWSAYRCVYAELEQGGKICVLQNGKWYEVSKTFSDEVVKAFDAIPESTVVLPNYAHADEGAYNQSLPTAIAGSACMDCNFIMHGGGHNRIEFCDLLTGDRRIIHIKRYSGSQQLSHLFGQGVVAGELFVEDESFREKLNQLLPEALRLANPVVRPDVEQYEIVFAIISKSPNDLDIPFFSKISFRNARRRLRGYGYKVTRKKIPNVSAK